jgi:hypothetical protein
MGWVVMARWPVPVMVADDADHRAWIPLSLPRERCGLTRLPFRVGVVSDLLEKAESEREELLTHAREMDEHVVS